MENKTTLIRAIVRTIDWKNRAEGEWYDRACWRLDRLIDMLPHGAGINSTSEIIDYKTDKQWKLYDGFFPLRLPPYE
jgi:hypothetical protein